MNRGLGSLLAASLLMACAGQPATPPASAAARPAHVLFVSIDGLRASAYRPRAGGEPDMPRLASLASQGVFADALEPVLPPLVYPTHATLVTGRAPDLHGVVADRLLGKRGVQRSPFWHATRVQGESLWQQLHAQQRGVLALAWPSTVGADIAWLVPDLMPLRKGETWLGVLRGASTPALFAELEKRVPADAVWPPAAQRDAALVESACALYASGARPALSLLRLAQTGEAQQRFGPGSEPARAAHASADAQLARLLECLERAGTLTSTAVVVSADRALVPVHTLVNPNVALADAELIARDRNAQNGVAGWRAIARASNSVATVYAADELDAIGARRVLEGEAKRSGAFRVVPAAELQARRGDPQAWFGLAAAPGYTFGDGVFPPSLRPTAARGAGGSAEPDARVGFVAWGAGLRAGVRVPRLRQLDVAPTLAALLGVELPSAEGRPLIGALRLPGVAAPAPLEEEAQ